MGKLLDKLKQIYDNEIRKCCDEKRNKMILCLKNDDEFVCKNKINDFDKCINDYNNYFTYKYSHMVKFEIYKK